MRPDPGGVQFFLLSVRAEGPGCRTYPAFPGPRVDPAERATRALPAPGRSSKPATGSPLRPTPRRGGSRAYPNLRTAGSARGTTRHAAPPLALTPAAQPQISCQAPRTIPRPQPRRAMDSAPKAGSATCSSHPEQAFAPGNPRRYQHQFSTRSGNDGKQPTSTTQYGRENGPPDLGARRPVPHQDDPRIRRSVA
jgi:hypothetical protein